MKNIFLSVILVSSILISCSSENDDIIEGETGNTVNVATNRQATGSSANDLLSANTFKKMIVELAYIEGFKPSDAAINNFKSFITNRTNKPEGVIFSIKEIAATNKEVYTLDEVVALEKTNRTTYNSDTTIAVWVLFINGKSSSDTNSSAILGSAYWNTSFVIYEETIHGLSNSAFEPERSLLESSVIHHEFGHILGLTNLGTELQSDHEDTEHPKHCDEEDCLMYWAAETSQGIGTMISGGQVPTLDAQCLADLKANGGK
ncbi:membrane metalloprotease [Polaribacter butkevichii]|uniref:Membrane metalloprotease n=1 Tax=Polaribacter butkevichii TaxID=218490 RepID=A0A2P6C745_9FLAO|nr:membrane metalloprotease [Polaribacter butkevichii]PQJ68748.1 membrane metalloprotease [Polaribacter butkevichii]